MMAEHRLESLKRELLKVGREHDGNVWRAVRQKLVSSRRARFAISLSRINRHTAPNDVVVVPGKVLSTGRLDHPVTVAAYDFSEKAFAEVSDAGGEALTIEALFKRNPEGAGVKIIA